MHHRHRNRRKNKHLQLPRHQTKVHKNNHPRSENDLNLTRVLRRRKNNFKHNLLQTNLRKQTSFFTSLYDRQRNRRHVLDHFAQEEVCNKAQK